MKSLLALLFAIVCLSGVVGVAEVPHNKIAKIIELSNSLQELLLELRRDISMDLVWAAEKEYESLTPEQVKTLIRWEGTYKMSIDFALQPLKMMDKKLIEAEEDGRHFVQRFIETCRRFSQTFYSDWATSLDLDKPPNECTIFANVALGKENANLTEGHVEGCKRLIETWRKRLEVLRTSVHDNLDELINIYTFFASRLFGPLIELLDKAESNDRIDELMENYRAQLRSLGVVVETPLQQQEEPVKEKPIGIPVAVSRLSVTPNTDELL